MDADTRPMFRRSLGKSRTAEVSECVDWSNKVNSLQFLLDHQPSFAIRKNENLPQQSKSRTSL